MGDTWDARPCTRKAWRRRMGIARLACSGPALAISLANLGRAAAIRSSGCPGRGACRSELVSIVGRARTRCRSRRRDMGLALPVSLTRARVERSVRPSRRRIRTILGGATRSGARVGSSGCSG